MIDWCKNKVVVTGDDKEIARFKQTCIRLDEKGKSCFDFDSLIPKPIILRDTEVSQQVGGARLILGREDLGRFLRNVYFNIGIAMTCAR